MSSSSGKYGESISTASSPERRARALVCQRLLVTTIASRPSATARIRRSRRAEQLGRVAERLDLFRRLLLALCQLAALAVHPDHGDLRLQAGHDVGLVAGRDVHPARLAADAPLALLEVRRVGLVAAHLLGRDDEVEVDAEVAARSAEQLVVDFRQH